MGREQQQILVLNPLQVLERGGWQLLVRAPQLLVEAFEEVREAGEHLALNVEGLAGLEVWGLVILILLHLLDCMRILERLGEHFGPHRVQERADMVVCGRPLLAGQNSLLRRLKQCTDKEDKDLDLESDFKQLTF